MSRDFIADAIPRSWSFLDINLSFLKQQSAFKKFKSFWTSSYDKNYENDSTPAFNNLHRPREMPLKNSEVENVGS